MANANCKVAVVAAVFLVSCERAPKLVDYPIAGRALRSERMAAAAAVVVGTILGDAPAGPVRASHWEPTTKLQLRKLDVQLENVLAGSLLPGRLPVYYFSIASDYDGPPRLGSWKIGSRWILYLSKDAGVYRTSCDGYGPCAIAVRSGAHPGYKPDPEKPVTYAIADILFTPGESVSEDDFARGLAATAADIPMKLRVAKLQQLTARGGLIRKEACYELQMLNEACEAHE